MTDSSRLDRIAAVTFAAAFMATLVALCWPQRPEPASVDPERVALAESLATARAEARHNLEAWKAALDSVPRDTVVRRVVRYIARHDTAWRDHISQPGKMVDTVEVVRWLAVSDSTLRVRGDSLEGEIVQRDFDIGECRDALAAKPSGYWRGFGQGVTVGVGLGLAGCGVVR